MLHQVLDWNDENHLVGSAKCAAHLKTRTSIPLKFLQTALVDIEPPAALPALLDHVAAFAFGVGCGVCSPSAACLCRQLDDSNCWKRPRRVEAVPARLLSHIALMLWSKLSPDRRQRATPEQQHCVVDCPDID